MKPSPLDIFLLICLIISLPIYIVFLYTLFKFRKNEKKLGSPFFKLCFSLGVFDVYTLVNNCLLLKFPTFSWFFMTQLVSLIPKALAKFFIMGTWICVLGQIVAVSLLALNRLTSLVFRERHHAIWKHIKIVLLAHWLVPIGLTSPQLTLEFTYVGVGIDINDSGPVTVMVLDKFWQARYFTMLLCIATVSLTVSFVCYSLIFWKIRRHIRGTGSSLHISNQDAINTNIKLAIFGAIMFTILVILILYAYLMSVIDPIHNMKGYLILINMYCVITDVFAWVNPYLMIIMSSLVRNHMLMVVCPWRAGQEAQEPDQPSNEGIELIEFPLLERPWKRLDEGERTVQTVSPSDPH